MSMETVYNFSGSARAFRDTIVLELADRANRITTYAFASKNAKHREHALTEAAALREFQEFLKKIDFAELGVQTPTPDFCLDAPPPCEGAHECTG